MKDLKEIEDPGIEIFRIDLEGEDRRTTDQGGPAKKMTDLLEDPEKKMIDLEDLEKIEKIEGTLEEMKGEEVTVKKGEVIVTEDLETMRIEDPEILKTEDPETTKTEGKEDLPLAGPKFQPLSLEMRTSTSSQE